MRLLILLPCFVLASALSAQAAAMGVEDLCPTEPNVSGAEARCLSAITAAEGRGEREQLSQLLESLAVIYEREDRYADAIGALRRVLKVSEPSRPYNASTHLASLLTKTGELQEARSILVALLPAGDDLSRGDLVKKGQLELRLAEISAELNETDTAERHYLSSIEAFSAGLGSGQGNPSVGHLIRFYIRRGRTQDAIRTCERYRELLKLEEASAADPCESIPRSSENGPEASKPNSSVK